MKKSRLFTLVVAVGWLSVTMLSQVCQADEVKDHHAKDLDSPAVFQAAGPTSAAIQSTVDAYRAALGDPNNGNNPGPLASGRREINWDGGGGNFTTTAPVTPFNVFLNTRGSQFTTPGTGLSQAPPVADPVLDPPGLAGLFNNPTYGDIFSTFSPERLFTPVGSNITEGLFFVPGTNGTVLQQRSVASARSSQMWISRMGSGLASGTSTVGQYADRVLRRRRQADLQRFRPGLARRWEPVLLRHRV